MKMHLILTSFLLGLSGLLHSSPAASGYPGAPDIHPELSRFLDAEQRANGVVQSAGAPTSTYKQNNLELVGFLPLGPLVSDVWAHGDFAYVGGLGPFPTRIVDISDPANPQQVAELASAEPGSSPQDVKVARIHTKHFHGDLLVVANDGGAPPTFGGIQLFDVSDPANPVLLSAPRIGPVHNVYVYETKGHKHSYKHHSHGHSKNKGHGDRVYVLLAIPEVPASDCRHYFIKNCTPGSH